MPSVVADGETFNGVATRELVAANHDFPDRASTEIRCLVLVTVYHSNEMLVTDNSIDRLGEVGLEGRKGAGHNFSFALGGAHFGVIIGPQLPKGSKPFGAVKRALIPQFLYLIRQRRMLSLGRGRMNKHRVMLEMFWVVPLRILRLAVEFQGAGQDKTSQRLFQVFVILATKTVNSSDKRDFRLAEIIFCQIGIIDDRIEEIRNPH